MRWLACIVISLFLTSVAQCATDTWTGAVDTNWSTNGNWSQGAPPGSADTAEFASSGTSVTVDGAYTVATVLLDGTQDMAFTVSGGGPSLTITAGLTMSGSNNFTLGCPIVLGADQTWNQGGGGLLTIYGAISGSGALTKSGSGTVSVTGANTYAGATIVTAGIMSVDSGGSIIGTLSLITQTGGSFIVNNGTVTLASSTSSIFSPGYGATGTASITVNSGGTLNVGAGGGLTFIGGGPSAGPFGTGILNVEGGTVNVGASGVNPNNAIYLNGYGGTGILNLDGGTLNTARPIFDGGDNSSVINFNGATVACTVTCDLFDGCGNLYVRNGGMIFDIASGCTVTIGSIFQHSIYGGDNATDGGLTMVDSGTLVFGADSTYNGGTTINQGTVNTGGFGLGSGAVTVASAGTLGVTGRAGLAARYFNESPNSLNFASIQALQAHLSGQTQVLGNTTWTLDFGSDGSGFPSPYSSSAMDFEAIYSGRLNITTPGIYTFSTSSDDGSMLWIDGSLVVYNNYSQPVTTHSGKMSLTAGLHDIVLGYYQGGGGYGLYALMSGAGNTTMADIATNNVSLTPDLVIPSLSGSGSVVLGTGNLVVGLSNANTSFSGVISGSGGVVKLGTGTQTLANANTYSGQSGIFVGTLQMGVANALLQTGSVVDYATLDLAGNSLAVGSLTGSGTVDTTLSGTPTLTVGQGDFSSNFSGVIQNTAGALSLTKTGAGSLALLSENTYSGGTIIAGGTLLAGRLKPLTSNLLYWLDASSPANYAQSGGVVTSWTDLSGNGNDFIGGNGPTIASGAVNGLDAFSFAPYQTLTMGNATSPETVFIVNVVNGYNSIDGIFGPYGGDNGIRLSNYTTWSNPGNGNDFTNPEGIMYINGVAGNTFNFGQAHLLEAYAGSSTPFPWSSTALSDYLWNYGRAYTGDICEILVYDTPLNGSDRATIETYLMNKWMNSPGSGPFLPVGTAVQIATGATMDLQGTAMTIGSLAGYGGGAGTVTNNGYSAAGLTVGNAANTTFAGAIQDGAFPLALTKTGSGTLTLNGTCGYSGSTTVSAGELVINGACTTNAVSVASGATLAGVGSITGGVSVASGGSLAPGDASPGVLTIAAGGTALTLSAGSTCELALGTSSDQIACSGSISNIALGGSLVITNSGGLTAGIFQLMTFTGSSTGGTFSSLTMPSGFTGVVSIDNSVSHAVLLTVSDLTISANTGLTLAAGTSATITNTQLQVTSGSEGPSGVTFTISAIPIHGMLRKNLVALANGGTFTQADINAGNISYEHGDLVDLSDGFSFSVSDGSQTIGPTSFSCTATGSGLSTALQLWWTFDDGAGNVARDDSGNGNHGIFTGSDWSWGTGQVGGDVIFGSANSTSYVTTTNLTWTPSAYSVCWRLNPSALSDYNQVLSDTAGWAQTFVSATTSGGDLYVGLVGNDNTNGRFTPSDLPAQLSVGTWAGLAFVYPGSSTNSSFYTDGQLQASKLLSYSSNAWSGLTTNGGVIPSGLDVAGALDDVRVYGRALTAQETLAIYQASSDAAPVLASVAATATYIAGSAAVAVDSASSATVSDSDNLCLGGGMLLVEITNLSLAEDALSVANGVNGITVSGATVSYSGNPIGTIDSTINGSGTGLKIAFTTQYATPAALQALVRSLRYQDTNASPTTTTRTIRLAVSDGLQLSAPAYVAMTCIGPFQVVTNSGLTVAPGASVTVENTSLQVAAANEADSGVTYTVTTLPQHGALRTCSGGNPVALALNATFTQADIDNDLISYEHGDLSASSDSFQFTAADAYSQTIGTTTVAITVSGTGLVNALQGWWRFDAAPTTTTAVDSSGNSATGTLVNMAGDGTSWVTGQVNGAISLNGSSNYVDIPSGIALVNSSITISAWAKRTSNGYYNMVVGQGAPGLDSALQFGFRNNNAFTFGFWSDDTDSTSTFSDSAWHHWVGTYNSTTKARLLYLDGVAIPVTTATASGNYLGSGDLHIGDSTALDLEGGVFVSYFPGSIDEVRIYGRSCSPGEVKLLYQQAAPVLSGLSSTQTFTQFAGAVPLSSSTASISDADCLYFSAGSLQLANTNSTATSTDQLAVATTGGITLSSGTISYGGNAFATIDGTATGVNGLNLLIHFTTTAATPTAVAALINALTFSTSGTPASLTTRALTLTVSDIAFSATATVSMSVVGVPVVTARATQDLNGDGYIDNILVTTDLALNDDFSNFHATVAGYTVTGYAAGPSSTQFYIQFTQGGTPDTGATPVVQITTNTSLAASSGGQLLALDGAGVTATDAAPPVLMSASWSDGGTAGVSAGDTLSLTFSESVTATGLGPADLGLPVTSDTLSSTAAVTQTGSTLTLTLAGTPLLCPGGTYSASALSAGDPSGIYIATPGVIVDGAGLNPGTGSAGSALDIGPTSTTVDIGWTGASDPQTWALSSIPLGYVASSHGSSLDLQLLNAGNCSVAITITSGTSGPGGAWAPASVAGANTFLVKADNSANAATSGAGPLVATNYAVTVGSSATGLYALVYSGMTETFALLFQAPLTITSGSGTPESIAIVITAAVTP